MDLPTWAEAAILFGCVFLFLAAGMWVAFALATAGMIGLTFLVGDMQFLVASLQFNALNNFAIVAVPMYVFMGELALQGGLSRQLYRGAARLTAVVPGGLTHSNIVACGVFAAVSGSSVATSATIGTVAIPEQAERGYNRRLVMGSIAAGGTLGILIPPSITLILYGAFQNVSVARLFIGGIVPGIVLALLFLLWIGLASQMFPHWSPAREKLSWRFLGDIGRALLEIWPFAVLIAIIMGGIYTGFFTPAEAAGIAIIVTLVILAIQGKLSASLISRAGMATVRTTSMILFILIGARILTTAMSQLKLPAEISEYVLSLELPGMVIWVFVVIMYLLLGCFMDGISLMLLTLPVTFPLLINGLGFDPVWFGVLLTVLIEAALITPPVGLNLFVIHGIAGGRSFQDVVYGVMPFFLLMLLSIVIFTVFPGLVTWLPSTVMDIR
ncbi:MAG: TRAP transporter large permease [Gammaproteobacteria bacterium]